MYHNNCHFRLINGLFVSRKEPHKTYTIARNDYKPEMKAEKIYQ